MTMRRRRNGAVYAARVNGMVFMFVVWREDDGYWYGEMFRSGGSVFTCNNPEREVVLCNAEVYIEAEAREERSHDVA